MPPQRMGGRVVLHSRELENYWCRVLRHTACEDCKREELWREQEPLWMAWKSLCFLGQWWVIDEVCAAPGTQGQCNKVTENLFLPFGYLWDLIQKTYPKNHITEVKTRMLQWVTYLWCESSVLLLFLSNDARKHSRSFYVSHINPVGFIFFLIEFYW